MQLDDVVSSTVTGPRVEEAMYRYMCEHGYIRGGVPDHPAVVFLSFTRPKWMIDPVADQSAG